MLTLVTMLTVLAMTPKPALSPALHIACPEGPEATIVSTARSCPALEVSGSIDADGVTLDPVFTTMVSPSELMRFGHGDAMLSGFAADGRPIFVQPLVSGGPFHVYIPLEQPSEEALARLTLSFNGVVVERVAKPFVEPHAEAVSVDDGNVLFVWDAQRFPAIRISAVPLGPPIATGNGSSTFEELNVATTARRLFVEFSDGVRTYARIYNVFGRLP